MKEARRFSYPLPIGLALAVVLFFPMTPENTNNPIQDDNQVVDARFFSSMRYRMVGPYRGGRVTAVSGVPGEMHTFYFGGTGGGVWKSDDAGESWRNITDGQLQVGGVGAIAVAPSDPNVVYVGTGSVDIRGNISPGIGMYRSTDAGKTWAHTGLREAGQIGRIQIHPNDPDRVFAAALGNPFGNNEERGVFRSTDGGASWEKVFYLNDSTGVVDVAMDPGNPRILYAAAWRAKRTPWTMISGGPEGGVYKSTDGGDTWNKLTGGLPQGIVGKVGVIVSPANPERVWAIFEAENDQSGLYRSDNAGLRWRRVSAERGLYSRPWYYMHVFADPQDENTVWVTNVLLYKSVDGGSNFTIVPTPHPDTHVLWINPDLPDIMVEGDDGGATVTLNGGRTWSTQRNQPTAEFYRVTVDNQFPYRLYGAQQDNSTITVPSKLSAGLISDTEEEFQFGGGESGHIAVDPRNPNIIYAGSYGGVITRFDRRTGDTRDVVPYPQLQLAQERSELRYRFQWNAPIRISPHDPSVLYHASQVVHRSRNEGQTWEVISPDLTTNNPAHQDLAGGPITHDGTGVEVYGTIFALEESPLTAGEVWAGSDDGRIHVSRDDGASWTEITPSSFPMGATVNSIDISGAVPGRALVAAYRYREADYRPYIFKTENYGQSWQLLTDGTNGIPDNHFVRVVREDPDRAGLLYAGTEFGMYISFDDGQHWQSLQLNLPVTPVTDIQVHKRDLVLATQGRSFWILDDLSPLHGLTDEVMAEQAHLFEPRPAHRAFLGGGFNFGPSRRGQNPPGGAILYYSLGEAFDGPVTIRVFDAVGDTVTTFSSEPLAGPPPSPFAALLAMAGMSMGPQLLPKTPGLHRVAWNLQYPAPRLPVRTVIFGTVAAPSAPPGTYQVKLTVGDWSMTRDLDVRADPRLEVTQEDYDRQWALLGQIGTTIERLGDRMDALLSTREQVNAVKGVVVDAGLEPADLAAVNDAADSIVTKLTGVQEEMQQTKSTSFYDPLDRPGRLAAHLAHLYGLVSGGGMGAAVNSRPTDASYERYRELQVQADEILVRLQAVFEDDVAAFNELLQRLNLAPIVVKQERRGIS
jgi:photosystem II stability/assembly factor-like uncharacterized protein